MTDANADGRKTEDALASKMSDTLHVLMDQLRATIANSEKRSATDHDVYDSYGRVRDRELGHAAKLGSVSAQLATAFVRLRTTAESKTREK